MRTIAEIRKQNAFKLAERSANFENDALETIKRAEKAMRSFYRLAGFSVRKFYLENNSETYNLKRSEEMEKKELAWIDRVRGYLKEFHADVCFCGLYPSIIEEKKSPSGGVFDLGLTAWYC